jgi:histone deacetylase 1/2
MISGVPGLGEADLGDAYAPGSGETARTQQDAQTAYEQAPQEQSLAPTAGQMQQAPLTQAPFTEAQTPTPPFQEGAMRDPAFGPPSKPPMEETEFGTPELLPPPPPPPRMGLRSVSERTAAKKYEHGLQMSLKTALKKEPKSALLAMVKELVGHHRKPTWKPVRRAEISKKKLVRIIRSSAFCKDKYLSTGEFDKFKARVVAGGDQQDRSIYAPDDTSSPAAALQTIMTTAAIAAQEERAVATIDITAAYLNAEMKEDVYMRLDPILTEILCAIDAEYSDFVEADGGLVVQLKRALYGCVESGKLWYDTLCGALEADGFVRNPYERCLFNKLDASGKQVTVCIYVDDMMCTCVNEASLDAVHNVMLKAFGEATYKVGTLHSYVGMTFDFRRAGRVRVTMEKYVADVLRDFDVTGVASTPAGSQLFDVRDESPKLDAAQQKEFHKRVATLLYLAQRSRPDIATTVAFLSTRVHDARVDDWTKLDRALRYINQTQDLGLTIAPSEDLQVTAHVDASYAPHADAKSHSGAWITLGKGPIYTSSSKQSINTKSSSEAELVALSDASSQVIWTRNLLIAQGYELLGPATIMQDNTAAISMTEKGSGSGKKTRHIGIRYFHLKDRIHSGEIKLLHIPTAEMIADGLTKPLQGYHFIEQRRQLLGE